MIIQNIKTKREYSVTQEEWNDIGRFKRNFKVIKADDGKEVAEQIIGNGIGLKKNPMTNTEEEKTKTNTRKLQKQNKNT